MMFYVGSYPIVKLYIRFKILASVLRRNFNELENRSDNSAC